MLAELTSLVGTVGGADPPLTDFRVQRFSRLSELDQAPHHLRLVVTARADVGQRYCGVYYTVIGGFERFDWPIASMSPEGATTAAVLDIDARLVMSTASRMSMPTVVHGQTRGDAATRLSLVDDELADVLLRFLRALATVDGRRILAPLAVTEIVYRLLIGDHRKKLLCLATQGRLRDPVRTAVDYILDNLAQPLTVDALAAQVCLSPSAFSRVFRETTGSSPYQYVKVARLDRACRLLAEHSPSVAEVSQSVGYGSVSHFIKEFRSRFGTTPGDYASTTRNSLVGV